MTTLILLTLCNLALWWRQHRRAQADHAEVWQAIARVKMQHDALQGATGEALTGIDNRFNEIADDMNGFDDAMTAFESELIGLAGDDAPVNVAKKPADCNCANCRKRRQLETN